MIIFLHGEDTYRSRQKLRELKEKFKKDVDPHGMNISVLNGATLAIDQFRQAIATVSFFGKKRMVVIEDCVGKGNKALQDEFYNMLTNDQVPDDHVIIFWEGAIDNKKKTKNESLLDYLKKVKYVQEFTPLTNYNLEKWVAKEIAAKEGKISNPIIKRLVERCGNDLWKLSGEINKLVAKADGHEISLELLNEMVKGQIDDNIFNLLDAITVKNKTKALQLIHEQLQSGATPLYLLSMLIRQFRILLLLKESTGPQTAIAQKLKLHPYVVKKTLPHAQCFSMADLQAGYNHLLQIDLKTKTGRVAPHLLLDLFVLRAI